MERNDTITGGLNLLLLVADDGWQGAARLQAGPYGVITRATSPEQAVQYLLHTREPFSHALVEPGIAGDSLPEIAAMVVQHSDTTILVLLGEETRSSAGVVAPRARHPSDLARVIGPAADGGPPPALTAAEILAAFDAGRLDCQFQPIVRLSDGAPAGLEALARLHHPSRGILTPDRFIPQIEAAGQSMELTEAVIQTAMHGIDPSFLERNSMFLTVNLPLDVLLLPHALSLVETHRRAARIDVRHVLIELTESRPAFDLPPLKAALCRWRGMGYHLAIDDLGPEMVNQTDLFDLPFHVVKLDKNVVMRSRTNALAQRYLQRTIANAQSRSLGIIAEGIEDGGLWVGMRDMGVDFAQGFLIAHAMPANALEGWLRNWASRLQQPSP